MKFTIDKATKNDFEIILKLLVNLYDELGEERESIKFLSIELINEFLSSNNTEIFLVKEDTKNIGIFTLTESQAIYAGGKFGVIDEMYIEPSYRNKKNWTRYY